MLFIGIACRKTLEKKNLIQDTMLNYFPTTIVTFPLLYKNVLE